MESRYLNLILNKVFRHYESIGSILLVPNDHSYCPYVPGIRLISLYGEPGIGVNYYHFSLSLDPVTHSRETGERKQLRKAFTSNAFGDFYWIFDSDPGYQHARIVAHIMSLELNEKNPMAWVASK